jgi:hypothetical protein
MAGRATRQRATTSWSCRTDRGRPAGIRRRAGAVAGIIDHVAIDIMPVVFGRGKPYLGTLVNGHLMLDDPDVVVLGEGVLHLRYPVHRGR